MYVILGHPVPHFDMFSRLGIIMTILRKRHVSHIITELHCGAIPTLSWEPPKDSLKMADFKYRFLYCWLKNSYGDKCQEETEDTNKLTMTRVTGQISRSWTFEKKIYSAPFKHRRLVGLLVERWPRSLTNFEMCSKNNCILYLFC